MLSASYSSQILMKNFPDTFSKNAKISTFMEIISVGGYIRHTDGQTDMTELIVAFRNFAKATNCEVFKRTFLYDIFSQLRLSGGAGLEGPGFDSRHEK